MKDDRVYIEHILQSISRIQNYISEKDQESFSFDQLTQDAVDLIRFPILRKSGNPRMYPVCP